MGIDYKTGTKHRIKVMQAFVDGEDIQVMPLHKTDREWEDVITPAWNWADCDYRIKPQLYSRWLIIDEYGVIHGSYFDKDMAQYDLASRTFYSNARIIRVREIEGD